MREQTRFNQVEVRDGVYVFTRASTPYATVEEVAKEAAFWRALFTPALQATNVLIRDLRRVQGNNDSEIDEARNEHNGPLFRHWKHVTALMQTQVGALHARRAFATMGVKSIDCFTLESEAMANAIAHLPVS